jgi:hypothetical protein
MEFIAAAGTSRRRDCEKHRSDWKKVPRTSNRQRSLGSYRLAGWRVSRSSEAWDHNLFLGGGLREAHFCTCLSCSKKQDSLLSNGLRKPNEATACHQQPTSYPKPAGGASAHHLSPCRDDVNTSNRLAWSADRTPLACVLPACWRALGSLASWFGPRSCPRSDSHQPTLRNLPLQSPPRLLIARRITSIPRLSPFCSLHGRNSTLCLTKARSLSPIARLESHILRAACQTNHQLRCQTLQLVLDIERARQSA